MSSSSTAGLSQDRWKCGLLRSDKRFSDPQRFRRVFFTLAHCVGACLWTAGEEAIPESDSQVVQPTLKAFSPGAESIEGAGRRGGEDTACVALIWPPFQPHFPITMTIRFAVR